MPIPTEHQEQSAFVQLMDLKGLRYFSIPNAAKRGYKLAAMMKAEGLKSGVPDMFIPSLFLFIEMKRRKGGTLSPEQKEWLDYLRSCGYRCEVCRGADEAIKVVEHYLNAPVLELMARVV